MLPACTGLSGFRSCRGGGQIQRPAEGRFLGRIFSNKDFSRVEADKLW